MAPTWPNLPRYEEWSATCDTLHAHTQVLGKLAADARAARAAAAARRAAPHRARLGDGAAARRPTGRARSSSRSTCTPTRRSPSTATGARERVALTPDRPRRRGHARAARRRRATSPAPSTIDPTPQEVPWTRRARRGRRARDLRPRAGRALLRGRDPRRARARRLPRALSRALDAGQRLVGLVRPGGEPVLRPARRAAVRRLHHAQRDGRPGGRRRLVARRRALRQGRLLRLRAPGARGLRRRDARARRRPLGRAARRVRARLGRRRRRAPTRTPPRWPSRARPSTTPASSASGTRRSPRAPRARRHRSSETPILAPWPRTRIPQASIDWASAEVKGGDLEVAVAGEPNAKWAKRVEAILERLERPGSGWGKVEGRHLHGAGQGGRRPAPRRTCATCSTAPCSRPTRTSRPARSPTAEAAGSDGRRGHDRGVPLLRRRRAGGLAPAVRPVAALAWLAAGQASATRLSSATRLAQQLALIGVELAVERLGQPVLAPRAGGEQRLQAGGRSARRTGGGRRPGPGGARRGRASSRSRTVCAIDCGRMRSAAARSLMLAGPSRSRRLSTASWPIGGPGSARSRRTTRPTVSRRSWASCGGRRLRALHAPAV